MKKHWFIVLTLLLLIGCRKKDGNGVPLVPVDIYVHTYDPIFFNVQTPGGWEYITGGSRGILLYRRTFDEFAAFDRHCPYEPDNTCGLVSVDSSGIIVVDTCCGSEFHIYDGSLLKGPSTFPLKPYQTAFDGSLLHIFN